MSVNRIEQRQQSNNRHICKLTSKPVSCIQADDIDTTRTKSKGIEELRDYLEYTASGGERLQGNSYTNTLHFDSLFEEDVYHALVQG
ncbi:hypothetical protein [Nostoc sp.]|uniref:hypothetical protein n=1 Tax=Nostoc sp. TaxID=1180 RepID=UPI002FF4475C